MGAKLKVCSCYGHMPEACSGCNPAVNKPLLLNLNCADNVPNIKFNAVLEYKQAAHVLIPPWADVITRQHKQSFRFELFDNFLK